MSKSKEEKIAQMTVQIELFREYPQVGEFRTKALEITRELSQHEPIMLQYFIGSSCMQYHNIHD